MSKFLVYHCWTFRSLCVWFLTTGQSFSSASPTFPPSYICAVRLGEGRRCSLWRFVSFLIITSCMCLFWISSCPHSFNLSWSFYSFLQSHNSVQSLSTVGILEVDLSRVGYSVFFQEHLKERLPFNPIDSYYRRFYFFVVMAYLRGCFPQQTQTPTGRLRSVLFCVPSTLPRAGDKESIFLKWENTNSHSFLFWAFAKMDAILYFTTFVHLFYNLWISRIHYKKQRVSYWDIKWALTNTLIFLVTFV